MNIVEVTCYKQGCGYSPFPMSAAYHARCKKTGESFICPAGHSMSYNNGMTADQRRIQQLEQRVVWLEEDNQQLRQIRDRLQRTCQWVWCGFEAASQTGLATHMRARHDMPAAAALEQAS